MQRAAAYAFLVSLVCLFATSVRAAAPTDAYPNKTIRYVIPFPPGGITDLMARTIAQKTSDAWKQSVVIDNRPGANALLGADLVAKRKTSDTRNAWAAARCMISSLLVERIA